MIFNLYSIFRQVKKIITVFTKYRCISKNIQMVNEYLRKPNSERLDPKELDIRLGEITIMHSRAELYIRFLKRRVKVYGKLLIIYLSIYYIINNI